MEIEQTKNKQGGGKPLHSNGFRSGIQGFGLDVGKNSFDHFCGAADRTIVVNGPDFLLEIAERLERQRPGSGDTRR